MTDQVEMTFKKNRQITIFEGMKELKLTSKISVPGILKNRQRKTIDSPTFAAPTFPLPPISFRII